MATEQTKKPTNSTQVDIQLKKVTEAVQNFSKSVELEYTKKKPIK